MSPTRIIQYLRLIAGEVAEEQRGLPPEWETTATLDAVSIKLRNLADAMEAGEQ